MDSVGLHPDAARKLSRQMRILERTPAPYPSRRRSERMFIKGGGGNRVATTSVQIPARVGDTPGGPVSVQPKQLDTVSGDLVDDGDPVELYSWVRTASADPAGQPGGELWIFFETDDRGINWFTGQDCEAGAALYEANASADLVVSTTLQKITGTDLVIPEEGLYTYSLEAEISVVGIPGNQLWDLDIGLYDETAANWLRSWDWAGAGEPLSNPRFTVSWNADVSAAIVGNTVAMYAIRSTTTGTVTILAENPPGTPVTGHSLLGPIA